MAWRGLHLSRPSRLTLADGQMVIAQDEGETRLALEDVAWLIIDTPQATVTTALLSACMTAGIAVIVADTRHMPNGMLLPFHTHHRQASVAALQLAAGAGLRGRLWQTLVRAKITNQASVLQASGAEPMPLYAMATRVLPADPDNVEARAARHYWGVLFADFVRENESDLRNAMLNYGYAVMRGAIARSLVAVGLLPCLGIHHASQLNPFNLADDLIEPFRPFIDWAVWRLADGGSRRDGVLTLADRQSLAGILLTPARMGDETVTCLVATEMVATAVVRAFEMQTARVLLLPTLSPS
jgi:CRISPR-associated protein Cas1